MSKERSENIDSQLTVHPVAKLIGIFIGKSMIENTKDANEIV